MQQLGKALAAVFVFVVLIIAAFSIAFILKFHDYDFSNNIADWGNFGAYLGSILAAIFGFATFVLLLLNINISSRHFLSTRNHDEILLIYEIVMTVSDEIDQALSESDKIGEPTAENPAELTDFPLKRLRDRRIVAPDQWQREEGYSLPGVQLARSEAIYYGECELMYPERPENDKDLNPFTWINYFKMTDSPFYRLLANLTRLNFLLQRIHELNPESTLLSIYKSRYSTTATVLTVYMYLKLDEETRFLMTNSDYDLAESVYGLTFSIDEPYRSIEEINAHIDQARDGMKFE